ncbi:hypothetical protein CPB86DRAFT_810350 [Serendipita vermifera]|nr:hypothetical protein CPB86DRAFT_810350 [Serendipita vermifera]
MTPVGATLDLGAGETAAIEPSAQSTLSSMTPPQVTASLKGVFNDSLESIMIVSAFQRTLPQVTVAQERSLHRGSKLL